MLKRSQGFLFGFILLACAGAVATGPLYIFKDDASSGFGTVIDGEGLDSAQWTGWIPAHKYRSIAFDFTFTDANDSVTAVTMVCETEADGTTANDSGKELHILYDSATQGTSDSLQHTWSNATTNGEEWTWTVSNLPAPYLNCKIDATGTPAAADVVTVVARGITP